MSTKKMPPGSPPSPTDPVLAAIAALTQEMRAGFAKVRTDIASVRGDIAEVRADVAVLRTDLEITTKKMDEGFAEAQGRVPGHAEPRQPGKVGGGAKR